jgi:hypothetical protein
MIYRAKAAASLYFIPIMGALGAAADGVALIQSGEE